MQRWTSTKESEWLRTNVPHLNSPNTFEYIRTMNLFVVQNFHHTRLGVLVRAVEVQWLISYLLIKSQTIICGKFPGERPYSCDPCKLHFVHKESLEQHMKKEEHHKAVAAAAAAVSVLCDRIFPCDYCDRKFTRISEFQIHKQRHIDLKCDQCGKVFPRKHHLQRHKLVHSNEKPFVCDICGKRFKQKTHLVTHQKIHVDGLVDLHHCDKCDKKFRYRQGLKKHKQKH